MRSLLAAAGLALASCSLAPRYERPAAPVEPGWPAAPAERPPEPPPGLGEPGAPAPTPTPAADLGWRDVFGDERLQALVALALESNRDLRVAALNVELVRAQYRIQRAEQLPSLAGNASYARQHVPGDLSLTGQPFTATAWSVGGVAAFELDLFGRIRSLSAAALEQYLASEEAHRSAHLALVGAVATQYLASLALEDQVALARATLQTVEAGHALTRRSYEGGRASELDLRTSESQVETARVNLAAAGQQRAQAENALILLVGAPLPPSLPPPRPLEAQPVVAELPAGIPSDVLQRRPDVLAAEHALLSANASIGAARAAFFPSITLTGAGGTSSAALSGLFGGASATWSFSPSIRIPIFQGGALRASLDAAELRKSIQVAQYERAIQVAFREVADALVARAALDAQLRAQQARVEVERRRFQLSDLRYRKGVDSYLTVLTAQRDLFAAQQLLIQTRLARLSNLVALYQALGGGVLERSAATGAPPPGGA